MTNPPTRGTNGFLAAVLMFGAALHVVSACSIAAIGLYSPIVVSVSSAVGLTVIVAAADRDDVMPRRIRRALLAGVGPFGYPLAAYALYLAILGAAFRGMG